jgi:hypothetical protein
VLWGDAGVVVATGVGTRGVAAEVTDVTATHDVPQLFVGQFANFLLAERELWQSFSLFVHNSLLWPFTSITGIDDTVSQFVTGEERKRR